MPGEKGTIWSILQHSSNFFNITILKVQCTQKSTFCFVLCFFIFLTTLCKASFYWKLKIHHFNKLNHVQNTSQFASTVMKQAPNPHNPWISCFRPPTTKIQLKTSIPNLLIHKRKSDLKSVSLLMHYNSDVPSFLLVEQQQLQLCYLDDSGFPEYCLFVVQGQQVLHWGDLHLLWFLDSSGVPVFVYQLFSKPAWKRWWRLMPNAF